MHASRDQGESTELGPVTSFKYLGAVSLDDGLKPEALSMIAQATAALTKLKPICKDNKVSLGSKVNLMRSLVISIFLYACESLTFTAELEKRTQSFDMICYDMIYIMYKYRVSNEDVRRKIQAAICEYNKSSRNHGQGTKFTVIWSYFKVFGFNKDNSTGYILYKCHVTNEDVRRQIQAVICEYDKSSRNQETKFTVVLSYLKVFGFSKDSSTGYCE